MDLPDEIVVWCMSFLSPYDLLTLAATSKRFNACSSSPQLWKFHCNSKWQYWPSDFRVINWKKGFLMRKCYDNQLASALKRMSDLEIRLPIFEYIVSNRKWYWDKLFEISESRNNTKKISSHFWASFFMRYFTCVEVCEYLQNIIKDKNSPVELGAIAIAEWKYPHLHLLHSDKYTIYKFPKKEVPAKVNDQLDKLGNELKKFLEQFSGPKTCLKLVEYVNEFFVDVQQFKGNTANYYLEDNSYINDVLKTKFGIPISLCVVYHAICRRAGILVKMIGMPGHFMAKFEPTPNLESLYSVTDKTSYFIDVFNRCSVMTHEECVRYFGLSDEEWLKETPNIHIWMRMLRNLVSIKQNPEADIDLVDIQNLFSLTKQLDQQLQNMKYQIYVYLDMSDIGTAELQNSGNSIQSELQLLSGLQRTKIKQLDSFLKYKNWARKKSSENCAFRVGDLVEVKDVVSIVKHPLEINPNTYSVINATSTVSCKESELKKHISSDPPNFPFLWKLFEEYDPKENQFSPITFDEEKFAHCNIHSGWEENSSMDEIHDNIDENHSNTDDNNSS